jgi:hypothetical protein
VTPAAALALVAALAVAGAACTGMPSTPPQAEATPSPAIVTRVATPMPSSPIVASTASPLPACTDAAATPAGPGAGATSTGTIWTVATGLDQPDDLLFADGSLLVAVLGSGSIEVLAPGAASTTLPIHLSEVEGMVYSGSNLYVAGQTQDAVFEALGGTELRKVIQLNPVAGQAGADGIATQNGLLIVPDSPRGVVDWVDPTTGAIEKQVGGFIRPTGAWPALDGSVLIADEFGNAVVRLAPDGRRAYVARDLPIVDDVAQDSRGAIFAVTADASAGRLVQLVNGSSGDLANRLQAPQGVAVDAADNLYFSESGAGRVDLLVRTFKLVPLRAVTRSSTQPMCIDIQRAAGFDDAITLQGSAGVQVVQQPGTGSRGAVLVTGCSGTPACVVTAASGTWHDVLRL